MLPIRIPEMWLRAVYHSHIESSIRKGMALLVGIVFVLIAPHPPLFVKLFLLGTIFFFWCSDAYYLCFLETFRLYFEEGKEVSGFTFLMWCKKMISFFPLIFYGLVMLALLIRFIFM